MTKIWVNVFSVVANKEDNYFLSHMYEQGPNFDLLYQIWD